MRLSCTKRPMTAPVTSCSPRHNEGQYLGTKDKGAGKLVTPRHRVVSRSSEVRPFLSFVCLEVTRRWLSNCTKVYIRLSPLSDALTVFFEWFGYNKLFFSWFVLSEQGQHKQGGESRDVSVQFRADSSVAYIIQAKYKRASRIHMPGVQLSRSILHITTLSINTPGHCACRVTWNCNL